MKWTDTVTIDWSSSSAFTSNSDPGSTLISNFGQHWPKQYTELDFGLNRFG